ncbi:MAG: hypothetical protein ABJO29_13065 [Yoonia sp.]|uniref:hypothetical protein n=1 Tax=Yoonia sp. TaxID=2212373 RepID=UPI0032662A7F
MFEISTRLTLPIGALIFAALVPSHAIAQTSPSSADAELPSAADATVQASSTRASFDADTAETPTEAAIAWAAVAESRVKEDVFAFIAAYPGTPEAKDAKALMIDLLWTEIAQADAVPAVVEEPVAPDTDIVEVAAPVTNEIELVSADGLVSVIGEIVSFDDDLISIKTSYGTVGIPNDDISCVGAACPAGL